MHVVVFQFLFHCHFQLHLRPINFDKWGAAGVSPQAKPRRLAAAFPEVPDARAELERQRLDREQRRNPRAGRRESKIESPEDKTVPRSDPASFSIRQLVDRDAELERRKVEYKPQTIGRGDLRRIRNVRGTDKFDEQIGNLALFA